MKSLHALVTLLLAGLPGMALGNPPIEPAPGGTPLLDAAAESHFKLSGGPENGAQRQVEVEGEPFSTAVELRTIKQPEKLWGVQLGQRIPQGFKKGDVLWVTVWMRATETSTEAQEGLSQLTIDAAEGSNDRVAIFDLDAGAAWQQFAWATVANVDGKPGGVQLALRGGFKPQTVQFGGLQIIDYGAAVAVSDLPHSAIGYAGMEADAPWRKAAAERIEQARKGDLHIVVRDAAGHPLPGAKVRMQEVRPAFGFGSCVAVTPLLAAGPDGDHYRQIVADDYNKVVIENELKWRQWDSSAANGHQSQLAALDWLHEHNIDVRGHNLVWPGWRFSPPTLNALRGDKAALEAQIEAHIRDEVGALKGQVTEWDVVNEPYSQHAILDLLGTDIMATWFKIAHEGDPKPELYLNDFAGLVNHGDNTSHKDAFEQTLRRLKAQGAPIGGLGIQAHFGAQLTPPEALVKELDRWAALGLDVQVTEFDIDIPDEAIQAKYTRDFMTAVFSQPAVNAILQWGFWEGAHWRPRAALYRKDWSIKPNGQAWNDLVLHQWRTDANAMTDASGTVTSRGFLGQYQVTVEAHGASKTWPLELTKAGTTFNVEMP